MGGFGKGSGKFDHEMCTTDAKNPRFGHSVTEDIKNIQFIHGLCNNRKDTAQNRMTLDEYRLIKKYGKKSKNCNIVSGPVNSTIAYSFESYSSEDNLDCNFFKNPSMITFST